jgi:hypothetical protein
MPDEGHLTAALPLRVSFPKLPMPAAIRTV